MALPGETWRNNRDGSEITLGSETYEACFFPGCDGGHKTLAVTRGPAANACPRLVPQFWARVAPAEDARGDSPVEPPPPATPVVCARITRAGIPCDLTAGHPDECRPLAHERVSPSGVTEAELAALASTGLVSARPDLSPYNRQPVGVSAAELAALASGPWARRSAGGRR